jgi:hypothetical protein
MDLGWELWYPSMKFMQPYGIRYLANSTCLGHRDGDCDQVQLWQYSWYFDALSSHATTTSRILGHLHMRPSCVAIWVYWDDLWFAVRQHIKPI